MISESYLMKSEDLLSWILQRLHWCIDAFDSPPCHIANLSTWWAVWESIKGYDHSNIRRDETIVEGKGHESRVQVVWPAAVNMFFQFLFLFTLYGCTETTSLCPSFWSCCRNYTTHITSTYIDPPPVKTATSQYNGCNTLDYFVR